ncbi:MAG: riboflavin biosynthesis protein RibF [Clostridiaceae bacterium]|nr:riboflavin biosynthesis protein RibF [Clostridiaceae bacterium]
MIRIFRGLEGIKKERRGIALGVFDGVHRGHQALIHALIEACEKDGLIPAALTFSYETGFGFDRKPVGHTLIMSEEDRLKALGEAGVREIFLVPLTDDFLHLSPSGFLRLIVENRLGGQLLAIGQDGHFGWHGKGDARFLKTYSSTHPLRSLVVGDVMWEGDKVSSTRIRGLLAKGEMEQVSALMTRPFRLSGTVISGRRIGSSIGFPTANIRYPATAALIRRGVYVTRVRYGGADFPAVTSVGVAPSVHGGQRELLIESYLYDFDQDLYGREVEVTFLSFVRDERRFDSLEELKAQMTRDIEGVRARHAV